MVVAKLEADQTYHLAAPEPVGELDDFFERLLARADPGNVFVGFDFPIGLPHEYCERAGITDFTQFLRQLGSGPWAEFYEVVRDQRDIALHRPFYPFSAGGTKQEHLTEALDVDDMDALMRRCERKTPSRPAASPLFWTLGAKQVGKAAIVGWRDLLQPALRNPGIDIAFWPFHGDLQTLLRSRRIVVAETYPAEACVQLGLGVPGRTWKKNDPGDLRQHAERLDDLARHAGLSLSPELRTALHDGFAGESGVDDRFDATVGLFSMLGVVRGKLEAGAPADPVIGTLEGWILGQTSTPSETDTTS
jgi:hypothetical protein